VQTAVNKRAKLVSIVPTARITASQKIKLNNTFKLALELSNSPDVLQ
jgi:hypothetical protein